ncbi:uncharacterized protein LOC124172624 isoform X2 [Ischnura elegans]|uniref:uncharacterized protein LOC124172624 isoform X2 n=1 Tax=Ischnura elegans TaxID=197161 RepID=UPI001ED8903F|nr:uncharacterized protein LOC124172624 isoform X2 [Ischnura elegans]
MSEPQVPADLEVEEFLLVQLVSGSLDTCLGLLEQLGDLDAKVCSQRSLLQLAISLGKVDWVCALLLLGADPSLQDKDGRDALVLAEDGCQKYPNVPERDKILWLVQLIHARERRRRLGEVGLNSTEVPAVQLQKMAADISACQFQLETLLRSLHERDSGVSSEDVPQESTQSEVAGSGEEDSTIVSDLWRMSSDINISKLHLEALLRSFRKVNMGQSSPLDSLDCNVNRGGEVDPTIPPALQKTSADISSCKLGIEKLLKSLNEMKSGQSSRDVLMRNLETSVTRTAEEFSSLEQKFTEFRQELRAGTTAKSSVPKSLPEIRELCVGAMLEKTHLTRWSEGDLAQLRAVYEEMYQSPWMSCLIKYLHSQEGVKVMVDFESQFIGNLVRRFINHDGVECEGSQYYSFPEFGARRIYVGGKKNDDDPQKSLLCHIASLFARMSMFLAFGNDGRPYHVGDVGRRRQYEAILVEAKQRRRSGLELDEEIVYCLKMKTERAREIYMVAAVPWVIAYHGVRYAIEMLEEQMPSLLNFYEHQVMRLLLSQSKVS